uniref:Uncharacterized protein n=1 Tax=Desulfacinum infernum TaxID=35837 RepID=A0A831ZW14_9BACT
MSHYLRIVAVIGVVLLGLCWSAPAQVMPVPAGQQGFDYPPTADPVVAADPSVARPFGVGPVAEGGTVVRLRVALPAFSVPVDLYIGIMAPALDPFHLYLVKPDGQLVIYETDLVAWKSGVTQPVDAFLFGDIPVSSLPPGQYHCYLMATPAVNLSAYYLWHTHFVIRDGAGGCGSYNGPRSFSMTLNHVAAVNMYGYEQEIRINGVVPFALLGDNTLSGSGTLQVSTQGGWPYAPGGSFSGSGTADENLSGRLFQDDKCQAVLEIVFDEQFHPFPVTYVVGGATFIVQYPLTQHNTYTLLFPVIDGATISGPPVFGGMRGSFTYVLHLNP